ncbi:hypothetical protein COO91_09279 (plasmid) [Nostoc flagelliforme CCNUN1]|uniref:Uncharacterized protein n=1 Tax=Nostoc flagelliforme CCNUN1 TaxID=2038116 RepID=A0A2K8T628_9NOSO|nr:hypothetical protein COO91_09279 [Nostoc flagelliforme CCNUN1]
MSGRRPAIAPAAITAGLAVPRSKLVAVPLINKNSCINILWYY